MESRPLDVVHIILRYVIGVPILFNPEELPTSPDRPWGMINFRSTGSVLADEGDYWSAERHRNACRRVCKAWDAYLQWFDHRLVRLHDVFGTKVVPVESLSKALFISPWRDTAKLQVIVDSYKGDFLLALRQLPEPTRIRTIFSPHGIYSRKDVSILAQCAPQIQTVASARGLVGPLHGFPALVHGSIRIKTSSALHNLPATLRSLSIYMDMDNAKTAGLDVSSLAVEPLPSLEHLSLIVGGQGDHVPIIRLLLSRLGSRVTTLRIAGGPEFVDDLLDLSPQVQVFYTGWPTDHKLSRPNVQRRLHTLVVPLTPIGLKRPIVHEGLLVWPGWTQIRRIISECLWSDTQELRSVRALRGWAAFWEGSPVRIEDKEGISIREWLISQNEHHDDDSEDSDDEDDEDEVPFLNPWDHPQFDS